VETDGKDGLRQARLKAPADLVVLDLMLRWSMVWKFAPAAAGPERWLRATWLGDVTAERERQTRGSLASRSARTMTSRKTVEREGAARADSRSDCGAGRAPRAPKATRDRDKGLSIASGIELRSERSGRLM